MNRWATAIVALATGTFGRLDVVINNAGIFYYADVERLSLSRFQDMPGSGARYSAAKAAVLGLTRSLAAEGAGHGIGVNAIAPGASTRSSRDALSGPFPRLVLQLPHPGRRSGRRDVAGPRGLPHSRIR